MPTYTARCERCNVDTDYVSTIAERDNVPLCVTCYYPRKRVIAHAPQGYVMGKFEAFKSPVDGSVISNPKALREHNARNGVVPLADGYSEDKVKTGDFHKKKEAPKMPDIKSDLQEAAFMIKNGYKPTIEVQDE